jgi:hypothetical protein
MFSSELVFYYRYKVKHFMNLQPKKMDLILKEHDTGMRDKGKWER